tara:strand:+ start:18660 stop:19487 length:828 start_codon:yes stop_codon:yes gene_type:complete
MNILSIDIGIKHLAHCLLHLENNKVTIIDWEVINLTNEEPPKCQICGKKASYECPEGSYCKIHIRKQPYCLMSKEYPLEKLSKKSLPELIKIVEHYQKINPQVNLECNTKNKTVLLKDIKQIKDTKMWVPIKKCTTKEYDLVTLGKTIQTKYDERFKNYTIDTILIENQLGNIAPRMKCIQGMVTQYFIMKNQYKIEFVSAMNKLKRFIEKSSKYAERKKKGIDVTKQSLDTHEELSSWKSHFMHHKKKDDLADGFLQGIWYIENNILNAEYLKL